MKYKGLERRFRRLYRLRDEAIFTFECLTPTTLALTGNVCQQILRQPANFGQILARFARQQILHQIFENPYLGQGLCVGGLRACGTCM